MKNGIEILTGYEFVEKYENINFGLCKTICNQMIEVLKFSNTNRTDMCGSDWLEVFMYDYKVIIDGVNYYIEPVK